MYLEIISKWIVVFLCLCSVCFSVINALQCRQGSNCHLPNCLCYGSSHQGNDIENYPQIVYFGFDDALTSTMAIHYRDLFKPNRKNANGCPITMSLYIQDKYTDYKIVEEMYKSGMEIGVHSVTHNNIDTKAKLLDEATNQRLNLHRKGNVPLQDIIGWRSPNLKTAGDDQPDVLQEIGYTYDISLTYTRRNLGAIKPFPFTLDYGNKLPCMIQPCPLASSPHKGFWEIPINSLVDFKNQYPCPYVDGCYYGPQSEQDAYKYLIQNFNDYYKGNREPLGFHMHAAWFETRHNKKAMDRFIKHLVSIPDVYIVTAKQMLDWVRNPVVISELHTLPSWRCSQTTENEVQKDHFPIPVNELEKPVNMLASRTKPTYAQPQVMTPRNTFPSTTTEVPTTTHPLPESTTARNSIQWHETTVFNQRYPTMAARTTQPTTFEAEQTTVLPTTAWFQRMTMPPLTTRQPFSAKNSAFQTTTESPKSSTQLNYVSNDNTCIQEVNCHLPDCLCRASLTPRALPLSETPQLVYFSFQGPVGNPEYSAYLSLFSSDRRNLDGCSITPTLFLATHGNYMTYLQNLARRGFEIALQGGSRDSYKNIETLTLDLDEEISIFKRHLTNSTFHGWRSPSLKPLSDRQFQVINSRRLSYDSSLVVAGNSFSDGIIWPYTLDFGWKERCHTIQGCPNNRHPGTWEVPVMTIKDYKDQFPCIYADGCMQNPNTAEETFQFLLHNFNKHYNSNKAPFGINLRTLWFSHYNYVANKAGLDKFIRYLVEMRDVYIVNINQLIDWMRNPTPLSQLQTYQPWICPTPYL